MHQGSQESSNEIDRMLESLQRIKVRLAAVNLPLDPSEDTIGFTAQVSATQAGGEERAG